MVHYCSNAEEDEAWLLMDHLVISCMIVCKLFRNFPHDWVLPRRHFSPVVSSGIWTCRLVQKRPVWLACCLTWVVSLKEKLRGSNSSQPAANYTYVNKMISISLFMSPHVIPFVFIMRQEYNHISCSIKPLNCIPALYLPSVGQNLLLNFAPTTSSPPFFFSRYKMTLFGLLSSYSTGKLIFDVGNIELSRWPLKNSKKIRTQHQ